MFIDWQYVLDEFDGLMKFFYINGDCVLGVCNGGKYLVDVIYIDQVFVIGNFMVEVLYYVCELEWVDDGFWLVYVDCINLCGMVFEYKIIKI